MLVERDVLGEVKWLVCRRVGRENSWVRERDWGLRMVVEGDGREMVVEGDGLGKGEWLVEGGGLGRSVAGGRLVGVGEFLEKRDGLGERVAE